MVECSYMYKRNGKIVDHLLQHCDVAYNLWSFVLSFFWALCVCVFVCIQGTEVGKTVFIMKLKYE